MGAISVEPSVVLHVYKDLGFTKPVHNLGEIDRFSQRDDEKSA